MENENEPCVVNEVDSESCLEQALTAIKSMDEEAYKDETNIDSLDINIQNKCENAETTFINTSGTKDLEPDETKTQASIENLKTINNDMSQQAEVAAMNTAPSCENTAIDAAKKDTIIIESVIQLVPAPKVPSSGTPTVETQAAVMEVLDISQTKQDDDTVVAVESSNVPLEAEQALRGTQVDTSESDTTATTSLGMLSQYGENSDEDESNESETASVVEVPTTSKNYRSQVVEIDSDSTETISSDSESETEVEYLAKIAKTIEKRIAPSDDDDDEDDDNEEGGTKKHGRRQPPRVRGEMLLDELPPIQDLQISVPAEECIEFGRVHSIVDQLLLVSALPNAILLDLDTVLFLEQGKRVLGEVFDVLGQVADPIYCVRFNTNQHIQEKGINVGDIVYVAPKTEYTQYVILSSLMKMRGSDASWENDIEPPPRYLDYSDDEEEREARQKLRKHRRQSIKEEPEDSDNDADDMDNDPMKRSRKYDNSVATQQRQERAGNSGRLDNRRGRRDNRAHAPRNYQPQHNSSWHSHYNQQYQPRPRPPMHNYGAPYINPNQHQRPFYRTPPPRHANFNPYAHPPTHFQQPQMLPPTQISAPPPMHTMPPPQMSLSPQMHAIPRQTNMYVPNPFAFRPPTLSTEPKSEVPSSTSEPSPPGAD
ncbi:H/ACA ribonucleoprotein complex non-core subunit NAF1 [Ceratitis capitata]|uniref:H/ACA ribonucleoprotein complex non-core subunit NAF1 n=1 Tax=Ceratitis capitata TaxID=7213 RepID=UPI000329742F|nr:H/ACA ribonucleoprotein complex non-core subunit NAF1 [Ceratitis capitata]